MTELAETTRALFDLQAGASYRTGQHLSEDASRTSLGIVIGHEDFDPNRHSIEMIDPASLFPGELPQVEVNLPYRQLAMNVMVDLYLASTFATTLKPADEAKRQMMTNLATKLTGCSPMDRANLHLFTAKDSQLTSEQAVEVGDEDEFYDHIRRLQAASDISFLFSDFENLNPAQLPSGLIAVKTNHPLELRLPAGAGMIPFGSTRECNTNKSDELARANNELLAHHQAILAGLKDRGILTAMVQCDLHYEDGYEPSTADDSLAASIREFASQVF